MLKSFLCFTLLVFSTTGSTVTTIANISGVSSWVPITSPTTTTPATGSTPAATTGGGTTSVTIYGGVGGTQCADPGPANVATCNSCPGTVACNNGTIDTFPLCSCNQARIYDNLQVGITVTRTTNNAGLVYASSQTPTAGTPGVPIVLLGQSSTSVAFKWSTVCNASTTPVSCEAVAGSQTFSIYLWVDNNANGIYDSGTDDVIPLTFTVVKPDRAEGVYSQTAQEGVGQFKPFPGDGRIYFDNVNTVTTFPTLTAENSTATGVMVLLSDKNMDNATVANAIQPPTVVTLSGADFSQLFVDNVSNGKTYYVRLALQDQASNILQFFPPQTTLPAECIGATATSACPYAVVPDQVLGLLSKDVNCFVATAAYGSGLEPKIKTFREFRRQILLRNWLGKKFVLGYYNYGPYAARFIADKPALRALARGFLWPLYGFSWVAVQYGFISALIVAFALLATLALAPYYGFRKLSPRG